MAEAVVSVALETLADLISEEAKFLGGVSNEVRILEIQLKEIRSLLKDADSKRHKSETVRGWIGEIKDLSYRAQDAIELYAVVQGSYRRDRRLKKLLRRCSSFLTDCFSLHQIGAEISLIKSEIARVTESMKDYGIKSIFEGESSDAPDDTQQWQRRTFPFEIEDVFVGKEQELGKLVSLVVDDEKHQIISVWGMGGIGKTTLVRKVYNHEKAKRFFEAFAWVCISQQCQIRSVLEDVWKQLYPHRRDDDGSNLSDTELIGRLCEIQKSKRCMIVIDDIWKIGHWEGLKHAFLLQGTKSKIVLTTRKQNVADIGYAFEAGLLSEDDCWELLKKKAFPHTDFPG